MTKRRFKLGQSDFNLCPPPPPRHPVRVSESVVVLVIPQQGHLGGKGGEERNHTYSWAPLRHSAIGLNQLHTHTGHRVTQPVALPVLISPSAVSRAHLLTVSSVAPRRGKHNSTKLRTTYLREYDRLGVGLFRAAGTTSLGHQSPGKAEARVGSGARYNAPRWTPAIPFNPL